MEFLAKYLSQRCFAQLRHAPRALERLRAESQPRDVKMFIDQDWLVVNAEPTGVPTTSDQVRVHACRIERDSDSGSVRNSSPPIDAPSLVA